MIQKILLCVDGSPYAEAATSVAISLAQKLNASLEMLSVVDVRLLEAPWLADLSGVSGVLPYHSLVPKIREFCETKAETHLQRAMERVREAGLHATTKMETGLLVPTIVKAEKLADLVILGQRGEDSEENSPWLGTHVEPLLRQSIKPCLVTPAHPTKQIQSMLAAFDGSENSRRALASAIDLARAIGSRLAILHVDSGKEYGWDKTPGGILDQGIELARAAGLEVVSILKEGNPEEVIPSVARDGNHDLVVMGAYGHTRIRELILGSVTTLVLRKTSIPVLLSR
jgi:nucleotide-binding universal stress UspA family protein